MAKIVRVGSLDDKTIDVQLDNDSIVLLNLRPMMESDPAFAALREDDRVMYPKTDGDTVYWRDGPCIALDEIFTLMQANKKNEEENNQ